MKPSFRLFVCVLAAACNVVCNVACNVACNVDREVGQPELPDASMPGLAANADGCHGQACSADRPCQHDPDHVQQSCLQGICLPAEASCVDDNECQNDTRCYAGACIPFGSCEGLGDHDRFCWGAGFHPEWFQTPIVRCSLDSFQVMSVPVVADIDQDGMPEVVTLAYPNIILAMRGDNCALKWQRSYPLLSDGQGSVAVADLDSDGKAEIVAVNASYRVMVLDHQGLLLATSDVPAFEYGIADEPQYSAPAIAELDGMAPPEIIAGAQVSRFVRDPQPRIEVLWTRFARTPTWGSLPIAADLDGDGRGEVIVSEGIYDGLTGADKTPPGLADRPFYPQVADFNLDGSPDLLLVQSAREEQLVSIYDYKARRSLFGPVSVAGGGWGGPAVIADFDGDHVPDFGLGAATRYYAYALKCARDPKPAGCTGRDPGVLWEKLITDFSSGSTGSSVFDFNGDGKPEVIYRDECWLRVYRGDTGKTAFARSMTSNTCLELPVIADVNSDGHADIVVVADYGMDAIGACLLVGRPELDTGTRWAGQTSGIYILSDPMNRWVGARPLWNQHSYHITNISDDLTVPSSELPSWRGENSYRQNHAIIPPRAGGAPDYTARFLPSERTDCKTVWRLNAALCNRGAGKGKAGVAVTFYDGAPQSGGTALCTLHGKLELLPGECEPMQCDWPSPPASPHDIYVRVADDGLGGGSSDECKSGNNQARLPQASCAPGPL